MPITMLYAGALGLLFLTLSAKVIMVRASTKTFMGDGGNAQMLRAMRGHANFAEYVPLVLVLMLLLEIQHVPATLLHVVGAALLLGRLAHGYTFLFTEHFMAGRVIGANLTLLSLLVAGAACLWYGLKAL